MREFQRSINGRGFIAIQRSPREEVGMPRIPDPFLDCVVYLYPSEDDAEDGSGIGGSGFLVGWMTEDVPQPFWFLYVVTAKHVILEGSLFIRMTTIDGKKHIQETRDDDWMCHPDGDDLAVCMISFDPKKLRFNHIPGATFMLEETCKKYDVGIGDEVFIVGRYINHEGKQRNSPTARYGIIGQMPVEPIKIRETEQQCFLVEARSIGGFSGSPVFWWILPFSGNRNIPYWKQGMIGPLLLGVEVGYILDWEPVCDAAGRPIMHGTEPAQKVQINTGMMIVIPAWRLTKFLSEGDPMKRRREIEAHVRATTPINNKNSEVVGLTSAKPPSTDGEENPRHLEDFRRLVDVAARKRPQGGQT